MTWPSFVFMQSKDLYLREHKLNNGDINLYMLYGDSTVIKDSNQDIEPTGLDFTI